MKLVWEDADYVEAWNRIIQTGTLSPVKDLAAQAGVKQGAVAQRMMRLRKKGLIDSDGNITRGSGGCPCCGAPPSAQRAGRAARRASLFAQGGEASGDDAA